MSKKNKIVMIGGGTGTFVVLSALKNENIILSAIVSMADDGGSTGRLRDQYGVLPPGDIRRSLVALSSSESTLRKLFNYRFKSGDLKGHNFGNIFLSALEKTTGNFYEAVKKASEVLNIKGNVIPVTLTNTNLNAKLENGKIIRGETNIDIPKHKPTSPIVNLWLRPKAVINPEAKKAIMDADMIIMGPGDIYTSIIPNFLVTGVIQAIKKSRGKKTYICNLMTKKGETDNFTALDFTNIIEKYLGKNELDFVIFNNKKPAANKLAKYIKQGSYFIKPPSGKNGLKAKIIKADLIDNGNLIRHSTGKKLSKTIMSLL